MARARSRKGAVADAKPDGYHSSQNPKHRKRPLTVRPMRFIESAKPVPRGGARSRRRFRTGTWEPA